MKQSVCLVLLFAVLINKAFAQRYEDDRIAAKDARKHIGEKLTVTGEEYKYEYRPNKIHPDSATVLIYLGKKIPADEQFIIIIKANLKDTLEAKTMKLYQKKSGRVLTKTDYPGALGASGKIIMFEGKAAIITPFYDLMILEPVD